jgi:hypothetical protein
MRYYKPMRLAAVTAGTPAQLMLGVQAAEHRLCVVQSCTEQSFRRKPKSRLSWHTTESLAPEQHVKYPHIQAQPVAELTRQPTPSMLTAYRLFKQSVQGRHLATDRMLAKQPGCLSWKDSRSTTHDQTCTQAKCHLCTAESPVHIHRRRARLTMQTLGFCQTDGKPKLSQQRYDPLQSKTQKALLESKD